MSANAFKLSAHIVDVLGNVVGRDQPILRIEKAMEMVSQLGDEVFSNDDTVFFDPFCKAGELLFACAFQRCLFKIRNSRRQDLLNIDLVFKEIYQSNRYYGLAPDERHHRISIRTFLGNTNSHDAKFNHIIRNGNYLSEIDGKLNKEIFDKEFHSMIEFIKSKACNRSIIAVGNPPYQESDGGFGKSASPIYNLFVDSLIGCKDISDFIVVIPSRWFSGGKGLDDFRKDILNSNHVKTLKVFKDPRSIFPTVDINGGVCFLSYSKSYTGPCKFIEGSIQKEIPLFQLDAIPDDIMAYELIKKIRKVTEKSMSDYVMSRNPFGITSTTLRKNNDKSKQIPCMIKERKIIKISSDLVIKNKDLVDKWKVVVPAAVGGTKAVRDFLPVNQFFIVEPGIALAETYIIIGTFNSTQEADKLLSFLKTSFCRYFIGLRKLTQHLSKDCWRWVPQVDFNKSWSDEELFIFFNLTKLESDHIKETVKKWS